MRFLTFTYIVLTFVVSVPMLFRGSIWGGIPLLIGSLLGFVGGSGMRGSFYLQQHKRGIIMGLALLFAGMLLVFYSKVGLRIFGIALNGDVWVVLGFACGFFAATPEDAGVGEMPLKDGNRLEKWQNAINEFGSIMEHQPLAVFPESRLPLPKEEMKTAFKSAWLLADPEMRPVIEAGYMQLSHFRPDITKPVSLDLDVDSTLPPEQMARQVLERKDDWQLWEPVQAEARNLLSEFAKFKRRAGDPQTLGERSQS